MPQNNNSIPKNITYLQGKKTGVTIANGVLNSNQYIGKKGDLDVPMAFGAFNGSLGDDLLPRNLVWITRDQRSMVVLQPPQEKVIRFEFGPQDKDDLKEANLTFKMPTLLFGINIGANKYQIKSVFATNGTSLKKVTPFPFWNIHKDGNVCTFFAQDYDATGMSIADQIDVAMDLFWNSTFNTEIKDMSNRRFALQFLPQYWDIDTLQTFAQYLIDNAAQLGNPWTLSRILELKNQMQISDAPYLAEHICKMIDDFHMKWYAETLSYKSPELTMDSINAQPYAKKVYLPYLVWHMVSLSADDSLVTKLLSKAIQSELTDGYHYTPKQTLNQVLTHDDTSVTALLNITNNARVAAVLNKLSVATIDEPLEMS